MLFTCHSVTDLQNKYYFAFKMWLLFFLFFFLLVVRSKK